MSNLKEIEKTVEGKVWEDAIEKAYKKAIKKVKIDGFRPGKAPKNVFLKKYGETNLWIDAADIVLEDAYREVLEDAKDLDIVARPEISLKSIDDKKVEFLFTLTLKPEVKLGKYKKLGVKKEDVKVSKEEVENAILSLRNRYSEMIPKEGKAENGDVAVIDFEGFKDGVAFEGGKGENYSLTLGSNTFIPGFEDGVIGMKIGEEKDLNLTFPKDYQSEELRGKDVVFHVVLNDLKTLSIPELDEDFFEDLGMEGVNSKKTLEDALKENIKVQKDSEADNKYMDSLLEEAAKNTEVDIPNVMIEEEIDRMVGQFEERMSMQGITLDNFLKMTGSKLETLREQMKEEASKRVKFRLMLEEIAKQEKIDISDEEAEKEAQNLADKYKMKIEEFKEAFGGLDMVKYDYKMRKAMEVLKG